MSPDTHQGTAPAIRPIDPSFELIQRAITTLEASSLLLERLHLQPDPPAMLAIVIDQLRCTLSDLEAHP